MSEARFGFSFRSILLLGACATFSIRSPAESFPLKLSAKDLVGSGRGVLPEFGPLITNNDQETGIVPGLKLSNAPVGDNLGSVKVVDEALLGQKGLINKLANTGTIIVPEKQPPDQTIVVQRNKEIIRNIDIGQVEVDPPSTPGTDAKEA